MLTIHADNGASVASKAVAVLLSDLGVTKSHSRPYTPSDNPYSEAQFKTLKYRPGFPPNFLSLLEARSYLSELFSWYHHEHRHSAIALMAPADAHYRYSKEIIQRSKMVLYLAYLSHPERFVNKAPAPPTLPEVVWNHQPAEELTAVQ